jgi:multiple sugar transport system permease protein
VNGKIFVPRAVVQFLGNFFVYTVLWVSALVTLVPFVWMVAAALKSREDFFRSLFLPEGAGLFGVAWEKLTLDNFKRLFEQGNIAVHIVNSAFLSSATALGATLGSAMGGYALAKLRFPGRGFLMGFVLWSLVIPGTLLLAPGYKVLFDLNLLNTYWALILPALAPAFGVFLFRQAMVNAVPDSVIESARIDGAGEFRIFFTIILPLVRPMVGAFLMITFLGTWNNFISPQIVLQSPEMMPLSVAISQLRGIYSQDYGLIMAGTLVSIAPVMVLFLLLQKEFISGLTSGSVKG